MINKSTVIQQNTHTKTVQVLTHAHMHTHIQSYICNVITFVMLLPF